ETALGTLGIPYALDGEVRLAQTPFGQALVGLLHFAWLGGARRDLFTFLRSPFSGVERRAVDFVEGRLRGRAVQAPDRAVEAGELTREHAATALERQPLPPLRGDGPGRVAVVDLPRARTRRFQIVFVLGLEEGSLPRRGTSSPFLDDDARRTLDERGARLQRP